MYFYFGMLIMSQCS